MDIVAVHCTHGFNRTGFLISCFLIEEHDWSVDAAVQAFRAARQPGIYKADYLKDIYVRYGEDAEDAPPAPDLPEWCFEDGGVDDDGEPLAGPGNGESNGGSHGGGGGGGALHTPAQAGHHTEEGAAGGGLDQGRIPRGPAGLHGQEEHQLPHRETLQGIVEG